MRLSKPMGSKLKRNHSEENLPEALTHPVQRLDKPVDSLLASVNQNSVHAHWGRYQVRRGVFSIAASAQRHTYKDSTPQLRLTVQKSLVCKLYKHIHRTSSSGIHGIGRIVRVHPRRVTSDGSVRCRRQPLYLWSSFFKSFFKLYFTEAFQDCQM